MHICMCHLKGGIYYYNFIIVTHVKAYYIKISYSIKVQFIRVYPKISKSISFFHLLLTINNRKLFFFTFFLYNLILCYTFNHIHKF